MPCPQPLSARKGSGHARLLSICRGSVIDGASCDDGRQAAVEQSPVHTDPGRPRGVCSGVDPTAGVGIAATLDACLATPPLLVADDNGLAAADCCSRRMPTARLRTRMCAWACVRAAVRRGIEAQCRMRPQEAQARCTQHAGGAGTSVTEQS